MKSEEFSKLTDKQRNEFFKSLSNHSKPIYMKYIASCRRAIEYEKIHGSKSTIVREEKMYSDSLFREFNTSNLLQLSFSK